MIVASLLLILVAVGFLVLGLAGGSSTLLVVSIAASLLAAVALVVGARQAVAARSAAGRSGPFRRAAPTGPRRDIPVQHVPPTVGTDEPGWRQPPGPSAAGGDPDDPFRAAPDPFLDPPAGDPPAADPRPAAGRRYADAPFADDFYDDEPYAGAENPYAGGANPYAATGPRVTPAGAAGPNPWADQPGTDPAGGTAAAGASATGRAPTPADPDDEPPPEPVTPERAALVAGLVDEVRVVDGRPRYHLAGCRHLLGRDDEALPVAEAVELGFTPCGRCTPDTVLLTGARPS
ncbi:hypothetical protein K7640_13055 [Micromonospora sp. PLK6-60]|nr:hypothetical protein [Micromonospora sp. PLK6-60]